LVTPVRNILYGVTRKHIFRIAKNHFEVQERDISLDELYKAKDVFISSTTKKILPIIEIDENIIDGTWKSYSAPF
jgi:branched-subunit amino acid aminotransferase/4-amino-4-deoxychorismate lyase